MILPESAHVAWEKGAEYFGVKAVHAPLMDDFRVDPQAVARARACFRVGEGPAAAPELVLERLD